VLARMAFMALPEPAPEAHSLPRSRPRKDDMPGQRVAHHARMRLCAARQRPAGRGRLHGCGAPTLQSWLETGLHVRGPHGGSTGAGRPSECQRGA